MDKQNITTFNFLDHTLKAMEMASEGYELESATLAFPFTFHAVYTRTTERLKEQLDKPEVKRRSKS